MAYKTNKKSGLNDIYNQFKDYAISIQSTENILKEMLQIAEVYNHIITQNYYSDSINNKLSDVLNNLTQTTIPVFLDLFDKFEKQHISESDILNILNIIESYFVRRTVCRLKPAGINKFFLINKKIDKLLDLYSNGTYLDIFKYLIYSETGPMRFPTDTEVFTALKDNDIYLTDKKNCKYILSRLEITHSHKQYSDILPLHVEHIMPQTLTEEWKQELGDDYNTVHMKYLHTIGNLTLTGYNPDYETRPFGFKKRVSRGFNESTLYLNQFMKATEQWTDKEIRERTDILIRDFMQLWPIYIPEQNYPYTKDVEKISLDNTDLEIQVTGRKPKNFYLTRLDKDVEVGSWRDLYSQIINLLYNDNAYQKRMKNAFSFGNNGKFSGIIAKRDQIITGKNGDTYWEQIIPGESIYFYMNKSTIDLLSAIRTWFEYLNIDQDDLEITLRTK